MSEEFTEYQVVFSGEIKDDVDKNSIANKLCQALKKDESYVEVLLSGKPLIIKRTKNINTANQVVRQLEKIGVVTDIKTVTYKEELIPHQPPEFQDLEETVVLQRSSILEEPVAPRKTTQIEFSENVGDVVPGPISLKKKLQYRFDTFMARGSGSSFIALLVLFVAIFLFVAGLRGVLYWINPELGQQYESLDFIGNVYITFLQLTDPGNMAQDILSSPWYKLFAVLAGVAGIIILSALIAVITTGMGQKLEELKRGRSKVIEEGHTLVIGWDEQRIIEILRELIWANESEDDACVVILADEDKQEIDDILRLRLPDRESTRIVTRSGKGTILVNLDMVSIESAKSVIILSNCSDTDGETSKTASDAQVIQTVLAVTTKSTPKEDYVVVAEVYNSAYREIIEQTFPDYVVTLDSKNMLAKLLVQTSRSVGLSIVYGEILSFDGCEMYFYEADWGGAAFGTLAYHFPDGVPIGVRHSNEELIINPPVDYRMRDDDEILIVAEDDSTIEYLPQQIIEPESFQPLGIRLEQGAERDLLIGWSDKADTIIREFSEYVTGGSEIDIAISKPTDEERRVIDILDKEVENIKIGVLDINALDRNDLLGVGPGDYGNIILLASARSVQDPQQIDSENIVTLLLLRSIFQETGLAEGDTKLITEVLESQNNALIAKAGVKDMIISNRLISMITAQISESRGIKDVYDNIFQEDGSEIYLKPLSLYFSEFPVQLRFADLIAVAQTREEVCFGVKIKELEQNPSANHGVQLIPPKDKMLQLNADDCLVVVAEDEL
jgi:hypothetical protein